MITSKLNQTLYIKQIQTSATTAGLAVKYYHTIKTIPASITNQRGNLSFDASYLGDTYTDNVSFYTRYYHFLKQMNQKELRIEWDCKQYEVINISVVPRNQAMIIDCQHAK